jgi:hypothetical protein
VLGTRCERAEELTSHILRSHASDEAREYNAGKEVQRQHIGKTLKLDNDNV